MAQHHTKKNPLKSYFHTAQCYLSIDGSGKKGLLFQTQQANSKQQIIRWPSFQVKDYLNQLTNIASVIKSQQVLDVKRVIKMPKI